MFQSPTLQRRVLGLYVCLIGKYRYDETDDAAVDVEKTYRRTGDDSVFYIALRYTVRLWYTHFKSFEQKQGWLKQSLDGSVRADEKTYGGDED